MSRRERVAVARLRFKAKTFCPEPTTVMDFYITEGVDIFERLRDSNTEFGGLVVVLRAAGVWMPRGIDAVAPPGGTG